MTSLEWEGIGGLVLFLAMAVLSIYFYGRTQRDIGYEQGRDDRYTALAAEQTGQRTEHAGRHCMSQPRASAPIPPAAAPPDPTPLTRARNPWFTAITGPAQLLCPAPAPAVNGTADTGTMTRIKLPDATTGAIRAIGDELVAKIERGELV